MGQLAMRINVIADRVEELENMATTPAEKKSLWSR
jgi:hypothetical protein